MPASGPAAWAAHAGGEFGEGFFDTNISGLGFFAGDDPANPFIAGEGSNVFPYGSSRRGGVDGFIKICG